MSETHQQHPHSANPQPASPFETAAPPSTPAPVAPATSPFETAAPAQVAPDAAAATTADYGDTSYLDNVPSSELLIKSCVVPGVIRAFEVKQGQGGDDYLSIAVQVYGDKMVNEQGDPVAPGKRLSTMLFPYSKADKEQVDRRGRELRNLALALRNVPLDGNELKAYGGWPAAHKVGMLKPKTMPDGTQRVPWSLAAFLPASQWIETKVMVQIRKGKDMDGIARNEFTLLAKDIKPVERKGRA